MKTTLTASESTAALFGIEKIEIAADLLTTVHYADGKKISALLHRSQIKIAGGNIFKLESIVKKWRT